MLGNHSTDGTASQPLVPSLQKKEGESPKREAAVEGQDRYPAGVPEQLFAAYLMGGLTEVGLHPLTLE